MATSRSWTWHPFTPYVKVGKSAHLLFIIFLYKFTLWSMILFWVSISKKIFMSSICSRKFQLRNPYITSTSSAILNPYILSPIPDSFLNHSMLWSTSNLCTRFTLLMGDTSRPSCNESLPIKFSILSRKLV